MQPTHFQIRPDFDAQSARPVCYFTNLPKMKRDTPQQQEHEIDEFVLRGPEIAFEGYMDIRPAVIIDTAREVFGMITPAEADALRAEIAEISQAYEASQIQVASLRDQVRSLTLQNAEQIVEIAGFQEELSQAYEDLYDPTDLTDLLDAGNEVH